MLLLVVALAGLIPVVLAGQSASTQGNRITYEPTNGVQTFAVREPVLRIKPGTGER